MPSITDADRKRIAELCRSAADAAPGGESAISAEVARAFDEKSEAVAAAGAGLACASGCAYCCHQRVLVLPHEAQALLERLETMMPQSIREVIRQRVVRNAAAIDALTPDEHRAANLACAFLVEGRCSVYDVRPSICASYHSLDRERCRYSFEHPQDIGTRKNSRPVLRELHAFGHELMSALAAATAEAGVPTHRGELHGMLRALMSARSQS